jgi:predicted dehydrogenase
MRNPNHNKSARHSRRTFLAAGSAAALGFTILPCHVLAASGTTAPSEKLNIAAIGLGNMGAADVGMLTKLGCNFVALCDVDDERAAPVFQAHPQAKRYKDFREMLDKESKHIDAVTVSTPDHIHAVAAMAAIRAGKHVYCQKPLTHTLHECRELTKAARGTGVATQMGNQGHATEGARLTNELIQAGVIGEVREVHCWSDRAGGMWKQGISRPTDTPPVPATMDWNLWLGPARQRSYHPVYAPTGWRGWWDFGTGALGDMGCHIIDHPVWALDLGPPSHVEARSTLDGQNAETYPVAAMIYYDFPARGKRPAVRMTWYDGGLMPPAPALLSAGQQLPPNGVLYVGSKGVMFHGSHGDLPRLLPHELHEEAAKVPKTMPRSIGHYEEWIAACKGGPRAISNFDYAGPLTETVLLGVLALRAPGRRLEWNAEKQQVTNAPELNQYVHTEYRNGWKLS